jgi:hypothetical protein
VSLQPRFRERQIVVHVILPTVTIFRHGISSQPVAYLSNRNTFRGAKVASRVHKEMAKISVARAGDHYRITLDGRLSAGDLRRLERACRYALEQKRVPLEINLDKVSMVDQVAQTYLERLRARGAHVVGDRELPHVSGQD